MLDTLMFQLYGTAFLVLGFIVLLIPKKDMNLSYCKNAAWLSGFGLLHSPIGYLVKAEIDNPNPVTPWIIVTLVGASYISLLEFARRLWNDGSPGIRLRPWFPLALLVIAIIPAGFATDPRAGLAIGYRFFLGVPATLLTGFSLLRLISRSHPSNNDKQVFLWLKFTAYSFLAFAFTTPFVATTDPGFPWYPTIVEFQSLTGIPIQIPRTLCAIIMATGFGFLLNNSTNMLITDLAKTAILEEEERKYRSLFEMTPSAIMTLDRNTIIDCNQAAMQLFGASSKNQLVGLSASVLAPTYQAPNIKSDELAFNHGQLAYLQTKSCFEFTHRRLNGDEFPARVTLTKMDIGEKIVLQGIIEDITEQKKAEEEIRNHRERLQDLVKERTADLNKALGTAEKANKAKSIFLSNMSHEFRTPLNAILGFCQLLQLKAQENRDIDNENCINEIYIASSHLLTLVNDLLDLNRIETGKLRIENTRIPVKALVQECIKQFRPIAEQRGITLSMACDDIHWVTADSVRLKQVIINLLNNAIKYNKKDGEVCVTSSISGDEIVRITFSDTGFGIAESNLDKLFKPFERFIDEADSVEGTGIGLALSKNFIEQMGGRIGLESAVGKGSRFWIELPYTENPDETKSDVKPGFEFPPENNKSYTLLYIEDNLPSIRLLEKIIEYRQNTELLTATSGSEGLSMAEEFLPDLILLDINLPGMDGYTILKKLRSNSVTAHIPVIAISGNALLGDIERGTQEGFAKYLTKPFDFNHFFNTINDVLEAQD